MRILGQQSAGALAAVVGEDPILTGGTGFAPAGLAAVEDRVRSGGHLCCYV